MRHFLKILLPGYPDEARFLIQADTFKEVLSGYSLYGRCLDAGCGEGLYSDFLEYFKQIFKIINLDIGLSCISQEKRNNPRHIFIRGSLTHLPFANDTFDCCLCSEVIEHINEDTAAVLELGRVIKPEGLLLMSVPLLCAPHSPGHIRKGYSPEQVGNLLVKGGFVIKSHSHCFYTIMKNLIKFWQWQFYVIGKGRHTYLPRFFIFILGYLDKFLKLGRPWDLVILAKKSYNSQ